MPNCFQLTPKGATEPQALTEIDERIAREVFGEEPDEVRYCRGWYDCIGLMLAIGKSFDDMRKPDENGLTWSEDIMRIIDFLDKHYTSNAWAEVGRR
jgi:hypothetical protein